MTTSPDPYTVHAPSVITSAIADALDELADWYDDDFPGEDGGPAMVSPDQLRDAANDWRQGKARSARRVSARGDNPGGYQPASDTAQVGERTLLERALAEVIPSMTRDNEIDASFAVVAAGWVPPSFAEQIRREAHRTARAECAADLDALASDDSQIHHGATVDVTALVDLAIRWESASQP